MTVPNTVKDGDIELTLEPKINDLLRRVRERTLPLRHVARAVQQINEGEFTLGGLLKFVGSAKLKAVQRFVVADNFKEGSTVGDRKIDWIGRSFREHYYGLVEENVPARTIYIWELIKNSLDAPVTTILGGTSDPKTQTYLAHTFQLMELGEKGLGRLDGYVNFSYKLSPKDNKLWVPRWGVDGGEFDVDASSSSFPDEWDDGGRVSAG